MVDDDRDDQADDATVRVPDGAPTDTLDDLSAEFDTEIGTEIRRIARERDEYLDTLRRLQADFENYRKRVQREQASLVERATEGLVEQLLPALDAFQLALMSIERDGSVPEQVRKGVELVYADLLGVLERHGVENIDALGREFDPNEHEAVLQVERGPDDPDGPPRVVDVVRAGWKLKGRVVRPAMVKVTR